jgi:hypothetical protein
LAIANDLPRTRARDQQADMLGDALRRGVLNRLVIVDPEPESLEAALLSIAAEFGEPAGPVRAVCTAITQEWEMAQLSPAVWPFLISQAMQSGAPGRSSHKGRNAETA